MYTACKLKKDTALKVFNGALERRSTSRTAISNDTGLSYVTVDKIVNTLIEANILKQTYSSKSAVIERRSRMLLPKLCYWIAVYEILPEKFSFFMYDLSLRSFRSFSYTPEDSIFIDDILNSFLKKTVSFAKEYADPYCCIGSTVLVDGEYEVSDDKVYGSAIYHLPAIRIKKFFSSYSFKTVPEVYSIFSAFIGAVKGNMEKDEAVYALYLSRKSIYTSYVLPDQQSLNIKDIGALTGSNNHSFEKLVKKLPDPDLLFDDLCDIIFILINTLSITKISVCDSLYNNCDAVCAVIKNILSTKCNNKRTRLPAIVAEDISSKGHIFISREIRDRWFSEKILADKA